MPATGAAAAQRRRVERRGVVVRCAAAGGVQTRWRCRVRGQRCRFRASGRRVACALSSARCCSIRWEKYRVHRCQLDAAIRYASRHVVAAGRSGAGGHAADFRRLPPPICARLISSVTAAACRQPALRLMIVAQPAPSVPAAARPTSPLRLPSFRLPAMLPCAVHLMARQVRRVMARNVLPGKERPSFSSLFFTPAARTGRCCAAYASSCSPMRLPRSTAAAMPTRRSSMAAPARQHAAALCAQRSFAAPGVPISSSAFALPPPVAHAMRRNTKRDVTTTPASSFAC